MEKSEIVWDFGPEIECNSFSKKPHQIFNSVELSYTGIL